jgi:proteasome accessory factor B
VYKGLSRSENSLKRMFERDKDELREMGIEVETVESAYSDETGYIIPRDKYYLPHIDLEPQERVALTMVSRLFLGAGTPFSVPAQLALLKLAFEEQGAAEEVPHVHWVETPRDSELLGDILDSLLRRKFLTFTYRSLGADAPVEREVEPYGLFNKDGAWYFVGQCHLRGEVRCFKLERIASGVEVNPKNPDFEVPEFFDMHAAIDWDRPLEGRVQFEAKVVFKPRLSFAAGTGGALMLQQKRMADGRVKATYVVYDAEQFVDWVLGFGTDALISSPPFLKEIARSRLEGTLRGLKT